MKFVSIFNDVLGPVMRGPSSSHTAGSYHIGRIVRQLLGEAPASAIFTFDPAGSYAQTFRQQGVDLGFATGLMEWLLTDERFFDALDISAKQGVQLAFVVAPLEGAEHPNTVKIELAGRNGRDLAVIAESTGGGGFRITELDGWPVELTGKSHETCVLCEAETVEKIVEALNFSDVSGGPSSCVEREGQALICFSSEEMIDGATLQAFAELDGVERVFRSSPVFFVRRGEPLFVSAEEMIAEAEGRDWSLGKTALHYEARLLGISEADALTEMLGRFEIMKACVVQGFDDAKVKMQLLEPSASRILAAESQGQVAVGGMHTRAAARALAAMHVSNSMGVVCAAPTGGAAGALPGTVVTLAEERDCDDERAAMMLFAAGAIGLIVARRATFAAEVAGCQVEIGAAGAMAAAAVVEFARGSSRQAANAAAIAFQNTMGSVCDLVQGMCEIPCHTRNALAASSAFVCADLALGGYENPVPLDETIDAVFACGKMLPPELRCTTLGGLAQAPSALAMKPRPR